MLLKKSSGNRAVFLYRCHDYNDTIRECYGNFMQNLDAFRQAHEGDLSVELFIIGDNLHPRMKEMITENHIRRKKYAFASTLIETDSRRQEERLGSGAACTPQHYTLYITSVNLCRDLSLHESDVVFFIEDDYKFKPEALSLCYNFARKYKDDFVSPFDHPDRYAGRYRKMENNAREAYLQGKRFFRFHKKGLGKNVDLIRQGYINYKLELIREFNHHWRTAISTCHTFLSTFRALKQSEPYLYNADIQRSDHVMWTHIWATGKSKLWTPVPGLAQHAGHKARTKLLEDGDYDIDTGNDS